MIEGVMDLVLEESKWLFAAMLFSALAVVVLINRRSWQRAPRRPKVLWAMSLFYGCMIGIMSFGHLLGVSVKAIRGTLEGSLWLLVSLGLALFIPSWWLALRVGRFVQDEERSRGWTVGLNTWLAISLVAFGPHNWPLALPAALSVAYQFHARRVVGWTIVTAVIATNLALFLGSLAFLLSGQSFEQFQRM